MNLFVPALGTEFTLAQDWAFTLFDEYRNRALIDAIGQKATSRWRNVNTRSFDTSLPVGTRLRVDRIYIRNGQSDFDSITFILPDSTRFWVKLDDANNIVMDPNSITSAEGREFTNKLIKSAKRKKASVDQLAETSELVMTNLAKMTDRRFFDLQLIDLQLLNLEHLAVTLRSTCTVSDKIAGWAHAYKFAVNRCCELGIDPEDMLYGLGDKIDSNEDVKNV